MVFLQGWTEFEVMKLRRWSGRLQTRTVLAENFWREDGPGRCRLLSARKYKEWNMRRIMPEQCQFKVTVAFLSS